ncbi:MAG TPA: hypothetical protein VF210_21640 [Pseudomonadales bacterium]
MSGLTIDNLDDGRELESAAAADVRGGFLGDLPYGVSSLFASMNSAQVAQNGVNVVMGGSQGAGDTTNLINNLNITPVNVSSPVTVVQGGLPTA